MYTIEYNKEANYNQGIFKNIKSITIDKEDILMMKYIDIINGDDKNLVNLYLKYLKFCKKNKTNYDNFTILNDNKFNTEVISSVLLADWLINAGSIQFNSDEYQRRKVNYQGMIDYMKTSKRVHDQHQCMLMQHFIDTLDKALIKEKELVKEK